MRILFRLKDTIAFRSELIVIRFLINLIITIKSFIICSPFIADNLKYIYLYLLVRSFTDKSFLDLRLILFFIRIADRKSQSFIRIFLIL